MNPQILATSAAPPDSVRDTLSGAAEVTFWLGALIFGFGALIAGLALVARAHGDYRTTSGSPLLVGAVSAGAGLMISLLSVAFGGRPGRKTQDEDTTSTPTTTDDSPPPTSEADPTSTSGGPDFPWATIGIIIGSLIVIALLVWAGRAAWQSHRRRKQGQAELAGRWELLQTRFGAVSTKYVDAETDPETVLERPIIREVDHQVTREFHNAYTAADAAVQRRLDIDYATDCVSELEQTWSTLWRVAGEVGLPGVSPADRRRAHNLLRRVLDESVDAPERETARRRLDSIIDSSTLDAETATRITKSVDHALQISGLPTLRELTTGDETEKQHP